MLQPTHHTTSSASDTLRLHHAHEAAASLPPPSIPKSHLSSHLVRARRTSLCSHRTSPRLSGHHRTSFSLLAWHQVSSHLLRPTPHQGMVRHINPSRASSGQVAPHRLSVSVIASRQRTLQLSSSHRTHHSSWVPFHLITPHRVSADSSQLIMSQ